jgi:surface protein
MTGVTDAVYMLSNTALSLSNFNNTLYAWSQQSVRSGVTLGADGLSYNSNGITGYTTLTGTYGWTIAGASTTYLSMTITTTSPNTTVAFNLAINSGSTATVYWGDKLNTVFTVPYSATVQFIYLYTGTYSVAIDGVLAGFGTPPGSGISTLAGAQCITAVAKFGNIGMTYCNFVGASNLTSVPATIPSTFTSLYAMFSGCNQLNDANISSWNTANITNLDYAFNGASAFNRSLSSWNTAAVTSMKYTFSGASAFNQALSSWNTAAVTNTRYMFNGASAFNQDISGWNTAAVTDIQYMFNGASSFNQPVNSWNVTAVTNMQNAFCGASSFNQALNNWPT